MTPNASKPRVGHPGAKATPPSLGSSPGQTNPQGAERGLFLVAGKIQNAPQNE